MLHNSTDPECVKLKSYGELVLQLFELLLHRLQLLVLLQPLGRRARGVGEL